MDLDSAFAPRIYYIHPLLLGPLLPAASAPATAPVHASSWDAALDRAAAMGFDHILIAPPFLPGGAEDLFLTQDHHQLHPLLKDANEPDLDALSWLRRLSEQVRRRGMSLLLDVVVDRIDTAAGLYRDNPGWFHHPGGPERPLDPRNAPDAEHIVYANFSDPDTGSALVSWWSGQLRRYADAGVVGFRFEGMRGIPAHVWRRMAAAVHETHPLQRYIGWTPGLDRHELHLLEDAGFDAVFSSIRWWDYRADWLVEEQAALSRVAAPIAFPEAPFGLRLRRDLPNVAADDKPNVERAYRRALRAAAATGSGWLVPMGFEFGAEEAFHRERDERHAYARLVEHPFLDLQNEITQLNALSKAVPVLAKRGVLSPLTGPEARATALLRTAGADPRYASQAIVLVANPDLHRAHTADADIFVDGIPGGFTLFAPLKAPPVGVDTLDQSDSHPNLAGFAALEPFALAPGEIRLFEARRPPSVTTIALSTAPGTASGAAARRRPSRTAEKKATIDATRVPRIAIESVSPSVDDGRFPAKRVVGEYVQVEADIFMDGHDKIAAVMCYREAGSLGWRELPMHAIGNDRWAADLPLIRLGAYEFTVEAWRDTFASLVDHIVKKHKVGQPVNLEIEEARQLFNTTLAAYEASVAVSTTSSKAVSKPEPKLEAKTDAKLEAKKAKDTKTSKDAKKDKDSKDAKDGKTASTRTAAAAVTVSGAASRATADVADVADGINSDSSVAAQPLAADQPLRAVIDAFAAADAAGKLEIVLAPATAEAVAATRYREFQVRHPVVLTVLAERAAARFANWYELFPRSQSGDPLRHGTFIDVIPRLPEISAMGFDVLYFPPIHPIGLANRKGPNNTLTPGPDDVGSPYAIGSEDGGHTAIHPELGSFDDFKSLMHAARAQGIELALDFAIQCSPDHPWLREHPSWFAWRPDGTLRYAENPPKKYQDIVNPDFYAADAIPDLWLDLRDVVLFWIGTGVKIFRVDNPHTKPLPFWEWMIGEVRRRHPEVIFLSEAFTRPKVMNRLAKVGFSQSYTYFTWRETKQDFTDYLTELTQTPVKEYFRPNFFVNTPDINPRFLQRSGRAGFVLRAALAATLAGVWGVYSGFELCEAAALPNSEEYLDSEKYQIRTWDWRRPGNIIGEITLLNRIRRTNPALHTHLGISFLPSSNPNVLFFEKATANRDNVLLIAIALEPFSIQESSLEIPLWKFGLGDGDAVMADDLVSGERFEMRGKYQSIRLDPQVMPFAIRRISVPGGLVDDAIDPIHISE